MAVYPIRLQEQKDASEWCPGCERKYTRKRKPVPTIVGYGTSEPAFDWECEDCFKETAEYASKYAPAIVFEDTVNWRGDYWEHHLQPSELRYKRAFGQWVTEGYETAGEEVHRTMAINALEHRFNAS